MRGHIQQRGTTSWRVKAYACRDSGGVRRYVERAIRGTRREAEWELSRLLVEVDEGRPAATAPVILGDLLDRWLDVKRRMIEPRTIESYEWAARKYVRPSLADRKVASLRPIGLDTLYSELHERGPSARTVRTATRSSARRWSRLAGGGSSPATRPSTPRHRCSVDARSCRPLSSRRSRCSMPPRPTTPTSPRTCGSWPLPGAAAARRAHCGGPTSTSSVPRC